MRREDALKKLRRILGDSLGYRVDAGAPDADERTEAEAQLPAAIDLKMGLSEKMEARRLAVLQADAEYQQLKAAYAGARKAVEILHSVTSRHRFTVGVSSSLFFTVKAQGDSWEEIIAKLEKAK